MSNELLISSDKYHLVSVLQYKRWKNWVYVSRNREWLVIPQTYRHVAQRPGDHCLLQHGKKLCLLHEALGYNNRRVLIGRDDGGRDWLVARRGRDWFLRARTSAFKNSNGLPDRFLAGATSATNIERRVAAALVIADIAFDTGYDLPGRPDFVIPSRRLAVFAHGCHFHGHQCVFTRGYGDKVTAQESDDARNYDQRIITALHGRGWRTLIVWECATGQSGPLSMLEQLPRRLKEAVNSSARSITIDGSL